MRSIKTILLTLCLAATSCTRVAIRDREVYTNELTFLAMVSEQGSDVAREFLKTCECKDGEWVSDICEDAARYVLVVDHRVQYHMDMIRYLARVEKNRPPKEAPAVPDPMSLCVKDVSGEK